MLVLIAGLIVFLGVHLVRVLADDWRSAQVARHGEKAWKLAYTAVSLIGFALILWGFHLARMNPIVLWPRIPGVNHLAALLVLLAFILLAAAYVPRNHFKARFGHPMVLSVKVWALAHLLANNTLADLLLFGTFLAWAVLCFISLRRRDRAAGVVPPAGTAMGTALTVIIGAAAWAVFAFWLHALLIGVQPI
ncbi:MAG TPA: NnrU family protein [Burkholderiaceae bacterium]|jgi:uncharacterized membrane protein